MPSVAVPCEREIVSAWHRVCPGAASPTGIETLKHTRKSTVCRLRGIGVVAKRASRETALIERFIYENVLPRLPVSTLRFYGIVDEGPGPWWLFLEDAGGIKYSSENANHRGLLAHWLGRLHVASSEISFGNELPRLDSVCYLNDLKHGHVTILENLDNPVLTSSDRAVLNCVLKQLECVESRWSVIRNCYVNIPNTLVHNDVKPKNIHIREDSGRACLYMLDWENAGYGLPFTDLSDIDLSAYGRAVLEAWPALNRHSLMQSAAVGRLFRGVSAVAWAADHLAYPTAYKGMRDMRWYPALFREALQELGLDHNG